MINLNSYNIIEDKLLKPLIKNESPLKLCNLERKGS